MDANLTGKFITELRKQKGFTQKDLAEKLNVTDKAISRWETGKGLPETSLLKPLADVLGVSVGELLSGKKIPVLEIKEENDRVILESLKYSGRRFAGMVNIVLFIVGGAIILSSFILTGFDYYYLIFGLGVIFIFIGGVRVYLKKKGKTVKVNNKAVYAVSFALQVIALILEITPYSAQLNFFGGYVEKLSFFNIGLIGYANFAPMIIGLLTVACVILSILVTAKHKKAEKLKRAVFNCGIFSIALSVLAIIMNDLTAVGYVITALIAVSICLQAIANRKDR